MQAAVLHALEFDRIRDVLASRALTALGQARLLALEPSGDTGEVRARLALTSEAVLFVEHGESLAISAPEDLPVILERLGTADEPLEPLGLRGLARFLASAGSVAAVAGRAGGPRLSAIGRRAASFADEIAAVERAIDPAGEVTDRASSALKDIREALRRQRARLRSSLDALAKGRDTAKYLQDQIVTDRNGRYVLVVRAEHRGAIPGLVHGSSASGASLYLEPLATVDLNNDVVALVEKEKAEIHRILTALTSAFRAKGDELDATIDVAGKLDALYAKVDLARRTDGRAPDLADDNCIEFLGARHPLLIPAVRDLTTTLGSAPLGSDHLGSDHLGSDPKWSDPKAPLNPVASDLVIVPLTRALVISGPNTGGKTVALKAFGLLALMAQAGLFIPVEAGSRFTPFRTVFADIGDEQSIAASLSTFSGHIANLVAMDRALELPALVLLDEVGGGTDPVEGGALGAAVVHHFQNRGALVVATTHDDTLKSYAATTPSVATAGFGFNPETYAPTYRLLYGSPGRSLALEIAERLGLPMSVIADARGRRTGRESLLAAHLARMDQELAAVAADREAAARERSEAESERRALLTREARLAEREAVLRKRLDDRVNEKLREARTEVDRIVGTLKKKAESLAAEVEQRASSRTSPLSTGELGALRTDARAALGAVGGAVAVVGQAFRPAEADANEPLAEPPSVGQSVFVTTFQTEGLVRGVSGKNVDVDVRGKHVRVRLGDLAKAGGKSEPPKGGPGGRVRIETAPRTPMASRELVVVGQTVEQALDRAAKFLDDALLADERRLRVVHGHGTGRLREALAGYFREHPLVASVGAAPENEGGAGATIVELKD